MDPNATMQEIKSALAEGDVDGANDLAEDLLGWMNRGGFPPAGYTRLQVLDFLRNEVGMVCRYS